VPYSLENYYMLMTESSVKLTYVHSVKTEGCEAPQRDESNGKTATNIRRAKTQFLDIGQCNHWDYLATFTSAAEDPAKDIRAFGRFVKNYNRNHDCCIQYLAVFELGEKGRRLHCHALLRDVPAAFALEYTASEYSKLPRAVKGLYSEFKTETGTRLCHCPAWKFGWSTLVPVDGSPRVVSYMTKYMTKQSIEFTTRFGGHSFFASKGLKRSEKKKIPAATVDAVFGRVPESAWYRRNVFDGTVMSACTIFDRDKVNDAVWMYYSDIWLRLQGHS
jgi:hypothetical protein